MISLYSQSKSPQTGLVLFLVLIGAIFLFFAVSWLFEYFKNKFGFIDINSENIGKIKKDLNNIKDKLDIKKDIAKLDIRLSVIEELLKMRKRGQIDPRIILIIIILILFYLYMKSKGG